MTDEHRTAKDLAKLAGAYRFAAEAHVAQRRKGERGEPYINHLCEVAELVSRVAPDDVNLLCAAVLHDTLEDTDTEYEDLERRFGADVATLVTEVTDDKSLPKQERKQRQIETASKKSPRAKVLKLCDKASNLRSIAESPPDWSHERKQEYLAWARAVAAGLRGSDEAADRLFDEAAAACEHALRMA